MRRTRLFCQVGGVLAIVTGLLWLAYVWGGAQINRAIGMNYFPDQATWPLVSRDTLIGSTWSLIPFALATYLLWPRKRKADV